MIIINAVHFNIFTSASFQGSEVYCRLPHACSGPIKHGVFYTKSVGLLVGQLKWGRTHKQPQRGDFKACFLSPFFREKIY
jgi:hypothetical protein